MKIVKYLSSIILFGLLISIVSADGFNPLIYQYTNPEVTVEFSEPLDIPAERQKDIADQLAGVSQSGIIIPGVASPDNIICTLFGHDMSEEVTVTVTHHKVSQYAPRCILELYHVKYCKRCDYTESELHNSVWIFCCPED